MIQKPLKPFEIDPKAFILMVESFIKSYPQHSLELKEIAEKGELELDKLDYFSEKGINFNENNVDYADYTVFWKKYLEIEDILYGNHLIKNSVFESIKPSNNNAIFKTSGVQNISYSLVASKVGIKIELLIKTLRSDIKDKKHFNKLIFDEIKRNQTEINKKFKNIVWDRLDNRIYSRIYFVIEKRSLNNKVNLPRLTIGEMESSSSNSIFSKMANLTDKFYRVFDPVLKKIDIKKIEKKL
jgi:hypothetical protein